VFHDSEEHRDRNVRYLCGHPTDAVLVVAANGTAHLVPWDVQLAAQLAPGIEVTPLMDFGMDGVKAAAATLPRLGVKGTVDLAPYTSHVDFLKFSGNLQKYYLQARGEDGAHQALTHLRAVKDAGELALIQKAGDIACAIADKVEAGVRDGTVKTEADAALRIEAESRSLGAEGTSFDTLAAGPERSFGIHCFPNYTAGPFGTAGLSLLDFGVCYQGYRSDITVTFARDATAAQEAQLQLVEAAYRTALPFYRAGSSVRDAANAAAAVFAAAGRKMPHGLGHGVGLDIHEYPRVNERQAENIRFEAGMVVTLEPGLYDTQLGGSRWENDILITDGEPKVLTRSRIIRL
jgi:Xaa-Pro dipeptidase